MKNKTKRLLSIILAVFLIVAALPFTSVSAADDVWDGSIADGIATGSGSQINPYLITSGAELAYLAKSVNDGNYYVDSYFKLANDISLNDTTNFLYDTTGKVLGIKNNVKLNEWTPIGAYMSDIATLRRCHIKEFDGNGKTIRGLYIDTDNSYAGLFGNDSGVIKNLTVSVSYVKGASFVGTIVGEKQGETSNLHATNGIVIGQGLAGGVFGKHSNGNLSKCTNATDVKLKYDEFGLEYDERDMGGIVGEMESYSIKNCSNTGTVEATGDEHVYAAGIVARMTETIVENCYNKGTIKGGFNAGGILGLGTGNIISCFNNGKIEQLKNLAPKHAGGIAGGLEGRNFYIKDCYNTASVSANFAGGIVGKNYSIALSNSYTTYTPISTEYSSHSALSGTTTANSSEKNCYFLPYPLENFYETVSGTSSVLKRTESEMKSQTFVNTLNDGGDTWSFDSGVKNNGYPILKGIEYTNTTEPTPPPPPTGAFDDVREGSWYYKPVYFCVNAGLFKGVSDTMFSPDGQMTREMFVTVLGRLADAAGVDTQGYTNHFTDVRSNTEFGNYIAWAAYHKIVMGKTEKHFGMGQPVTREQAAAFLMRYVDYMKYQLPALTDGDLDKFADSNLISRYARPELSKAVETKIFEGYRTATSSGYVDTIQPKKNITRAEASQIFYRLADLIGGT